MKHINLTLVLLFISITTFSQLTITGTISDESKNPLPFANIILYDIADENKTKGATSDDNGKFKLENLTSGNYKLEISMLGFETQTIAEFKLTGDKNFNITLKEESQLLNEVVVKSKRPVIKQTAEKLIVDLEKSEMINTNLQDVMRKIPGVLVTNNGISIAGNRGVTILINNKTTQYMDVETLLRDFPADNIAKIEVVEQPGAEYEASGSGAIINIILKKNVSLGTNGSTNVWIGEDEGFEYGAGFSISSYKNKLNWQARVSHSQPTWRDDLFLTRTVVDTIYDQTTREPYDPMNNTISGNLDYYLNDKNSIGIAGRFNSRISTRTVDNITNIIKPTVTEVLLTNNSFDRERTDYNINPYYEYKSDTERLLLDFNYINFEDNSMNTLFDTPQSGAQFTDRRYQQDGKYNIKTYRLDYSKTFSDALKISAGSRFADVTTDNDLQSFIDNNGSFDLVEEESSRFVIDETILAFYGKVNASFGKWNFSGGLRYEDSNTDGTSTFMENGQTTVEVRKRPIQKLFPSASISRKLSDVLGASLSYSYRIQRPSYNSLNSFQLFLDPFSANEGNPRLTPAFTNNYQFNLTYEGQPFFTIGYSETEDIIFQLIRQDNSTAQIRQQEVNVEQNYNWNFRLFAPLNFINEKIEGFTGVIVTNTDYKSQTFGVDLNQWNLYWFVQASYQLPWDINFEMSGNYGTGALEGQIEVDWLAELDFSFGKKFMDDKLKVNLGFNKMLNRGFVGTIDYGNGFANVESNGSRQNIQLRAVYSFGSQFGKRKSQRDIIRDEENRINSNN